MNIYQLMDKFDAMQPQIEWYGDMVLLGGLLLIGLLAMFLPDYKLTKHWGKAAKMQFGMEIRKHG